MDLMLSRARLQTTAAAKTKKNWSFWAKISGHTKNVESKKWVVFTWWRNSRGEFLNFLLFRTQVYGPSSLWLLQLGSFFTLVFDFFVKKHRSLKSLIFFVGGFVVGVRFRRSRNRNWVTSEWLLLVLLHRSRRHERCCNELVGGQRLDRPDALRIPAWVLPSPSREKISLCWSFSFLSTFTYSFSHTFHAWFSSN